MITVSHFFSDNALFQADSVLTLSGNCVPNVKVTLKLLSATSVISSAETISDSKGSFKVTVSTPKPSYDEYSLSLVCGDEEKTISHVLFGELWLASGQSNMEMANAQIIGREKLLEHVSTMQIRVYHAETPSAGGAYEFPEEPDTSGNGYWICADNSSTLNWVSAIGLKFISDIYDKLNKDADIPVGFLNASWGGTGINTWLSKEYIDSDDVLCEKLKKYGLYPIHEEWNKKGDLNFQQCCCQYNLKITPLLGMKVRGVIWYQGENECWGEFDRRFYADALRLYHRMYTELFAAHDDFLMISSLIYPWTYGDGDCNLGYLNDAFVTTAVEAPDKFSIAPIGDLEPVWTQHNDYHPIHPMNKYEVGERLALLAMRKVYGEEGQSAPAHLVEYHNDNGHMILRFEDVGGGLYVGDKHPKRKAHGLYAAGEDDIYLPAEYKIISPDTLEVWCDGLDEVKNVCYAFQSLDVKCNVFAGDFPVMPFCTEKEKRVSFDLHLWYDSSADLCWTGFDTSYFFHPIWRPLNDSEVCHDTAFTNDTTASVHVGSDGKEFGCYIKSGQYNKLDLFKYKALEADFYNASQTEPSLVLSGKDGDITIKFVKISNDHDGSARYSASFDGIPEEYFSKMAFVFSDKKERYHFVNIERIRLVRK